MAISPENWAAAKELFEAALAKDAAQRPSFLEERCPSETVRVEVERLLAEHDQAISFLSAPAVNRLHLEIDNGLQRETLAKGRLIAERFSVIQFLASGGMGTVYKAEDRRLHRFVAIKFLTDDVARSPQYRARFQREAEAASALNHPNICTIYDLGEHEGKPFIAMEFLEGMPLSDRIGKRPLDFDVLLDIATDITDGLDAAHAAGIIHRDIKPSNIFVTTRGHAKILDFGVAKITMPRGPVSRAAIESTQTALCNEMHLTFPGSAVGTVAYMSPEQVQAKELDNRTDLFSFGAVLYEMATGMAPFPGESSGMIMRAILDVTPTSAVRLNPDLPLQLELVINKCLEKDRDLRYRHSSEIRTDLLRLKKGRDARSASSITSHSSERVLQAAAPKQSTVGRSAEVVAMVKETSSQGLKRYLDDESISSVTSEDVRERAFPLEFPSDAHGNPQSAEVSLRLYAPDFEPPLQAKKMHVPPCGDSLPCTFLIRPKVTGDLVANLELLKGEEVIVSRPIRTHVLSVNDPVGGGLNVISIPLKIYVGPSEMQLVYTEDASPVILPRALSKPSQAPRKTVGDFTATFGEVGCESSSSSPPTESSEKDHKANNFTTFFGETETPSTTLHSGTEPPGSVSEPQVPVFASRNADVPVTKTTADTSIQRSRTGAKLGIHYLGKTVWITLVAAFVAFGFILGSRYTQRVVQPSSPLGPTATASAPPNYSKPASPSPDYSKSASAPPNYSKSASPSPDYSKMAPLPRMSSVPHTMRTFTVSGSFEGNFRFSGDSTITIDVTTGLAVSVNVTVVGEGPDGKVKRELFEGVPVHGTNSAWHWQNQGSFGGSLDLQDRQRTFVGYSGGQLTDAAYTAFLGRIVNSKDTVLKPVGESDNQ